MLISNRFAGLKEDIIGSKHKELALREVGISLGMSLDVAGAEMVKKAKIGSLRELWRGWRSSRRRKGR